MTTVLILEDCRESIKALEAIMKGYRVGIHALFARSLSEAMDMLHKEEMIDIFFLDINLDQSNTMDQSGILFAKKIREISKYAFTPIVFITSATELELLSYRETQCYSYITKPYEANAILSVLDKVIQNNIKKESPQVTVKKDGVNYRINVDEILCIEAIPRGIRLYLKGESLDLKYISIKQILEKLPKDQFIQCHRMYVVNTNKIDYVDTVNQMIQIKGLSHTIEIGITYKTEMRRWIHG
ncbi:MAG: LytTR family DNA-binding domain-containing protein [Clostridiales bacterium]|nr:LytTR family DNA-binding domain-containing protein [Clostridiales bacterium]